MPVLNAADVWSGGFGKENLPEKHHHKERFEVLDGWRAFSIILVLAGHLLPLGPSSFQMNETVAATGMVLFFILSGFLITLSLQMNIGIRTFAIRRLLRIVPLAWVAMLILLISNQAKPDIWAANLLFYSNIIPGALIEKGGGHLWSLCVEMQMYAMLAILAMGFSRKGLSLIPLLAFTVTIFRITNHKYIDIATWYRCDELLAGGILARLYLGKYGENPKRFLGMINPIWVIPLLVFSAHPLSGFFQYIRPYIAAVVVGSTLYKPPLIFVRLSKTRTAIYLAEISYSLYVIHGLLTATWLNKGDTLIKYAKRPLLFIITFGIAHLSTYRFENRFIALAKRYTAKN